MIMLFSNKGGQLGHAYEITIELPNADGLIRSSQVMLSGAPVGQVAEAPELIGKSFHVAVKLRVMQNVRIPRQASFAVSSSGLMGDKFVNVTVPENFDPADTIAPGELLAGSSQGGGLDELTGKGSIVMDQMSAELKRLDAMTATLNEELLSKTNLKEYPKIHSRIWRRRRRRASRPPLQDLHTVVDKTNAVVESANGVMVKADAATGDLRLAIGDIRKTADEATKTMATAREMPEESCRGRRDPGDAAHGSQGGGRPAGAGDQSSPFRRALLQGPRRRIGRARRA